MILGKIWFHLTSHWRTKISKIFAGEAGPAEPDWSDKESVANYLVENERPFAGDGIFDADWFRENGRQVFDRTIHLAAQLTNPFMLDANPAWRDQLSAIKTPTLVLHGTKDPLFSLAHGEALAKEIPNAALIALEGIGPYRSALSRFGYHRLFRRELLLSSLLNHLGLPEA